MTRKQTIILVSLLAFVSLAIGVIWTLRTDPPSHRTWWAGKNPYVRVEVWEMRFGPAMEREPRRLAAAEVDPARR